MRFASPKVNTNSRNPDVLPTFLHVIPKRHRRHPQLFPKVSASPSPRATVAICLAVLALAWVAVVGLDSRTAGARTASEDSVSSVLYLSTGALGAAAGDAALGFRTPYYEPPALADPSEPGFTINSGADQPDPFMYQQGGRYYLFTSQGPGNDERAWSGRAANEQGQEPGEESVFTNAAGVWLLYTPSRSALPLPAPSPSRRDGPLGVRAFGPHLVAPLEVDGPA